MPVIVGTDLSEQSLEALRAAFAIAQRRGDREVVLVNVLPPEDDSAAHDKLVASARSRIEADAARLAAGTGIEVRSDILMGPVDESLAAYAETEDASVLVVTPTGEGRAHGLGNIAEKLAVRGTSPLLVVRDADPLIAWARGDRRLRILVGVDESAACQAAIQFIRTIRRAGPIDIVVGHVYFPDEAAARYGMRNVSMVEPNPDLEALIVRDLRRRLGEVPGDGDVTFVTRLALGRIGDHMLEIADAEKVDLIVVGTRRKAGLKRLSSVSAVVLHDARQSVLCVPLGSEAIDDVPKVKIAVAATDRSAFSNLAIPWAYGLVGDRGEVHIVHIVEDESDADDASIVQELLELAPPSRMGVTTRAHVVHGDDPARSIAEAAERIGADVICICSHGRAGLSRALVGSVADKLMRACRRPVLVLRPVE